MSKVKVIAALIAFSGVTPAADENPDMDFLEWLGQVAEVEALGVDIDNLLDSQETSPGLEESDESADKEAG